MHSDDGHRRRKFNDTSVVIRHLGGILTTIPFT
jgi:hypothetical protein